ncbi:MAG TPA: choice-of-anchor tandem repeat GloVer-containing protein [Capsulimonadaceae bacterium]|jgi:uncharacterized repeat protein (TIGR03803 family)
MRIVTTLLLLLALLWVPANATSTAKLRVIHEFGNFVSGLVQAPDGSFVAASATTGDDYKGEVFRVAADGTRTILHSFSGGDGAYPRASLVYGGDGYFYGTTHSGGDNDMGTVYKVALDGTFASLYSFSGTDGSYPVSSLVKATDGNFYGTTEYGGASNYGTTFVITASGAFVSLHSFEDLDGAHPIAGLLQASDGNFYGTTTWRGNIRGDSGNGTIFKMSISGGITIMRRLTFDDGLGTFTPLIEGSDGMLYGTTQVGGSRGAGTVFSIDTSGTYNALHNFTASEGTSPISGLIEAGDGSLYGTTSLNGVNSCGSVFRITKSGSLTVIHTFSATSGQGCSAPMVIGSSGKLYGTTPGIGDAAVYSLTIDGTFNSLCSFPSADGALAYAGLANAPGATLIGTTGAGGTGSGTVFKIDSTGKYSQVALLSASVGKLPLGGLLLAGDGNAYGTAQKGGAFDRGSVFRVTPAGVCSLIHSFSIEDGSAPNSGLIIGPDGNVYGTTPMGGTYSYGTVFKVTLGGVFTSVHSFDGTDGKHPKGSLLLGTDGNFYGVTSGEFSASDTIYKMTSAGIVTVLHRFAGTDGHFPSGGLVEYPDGTFYGTTSSTDTSPGGTAYKITKGGVFTLLHTFSYAEGGSPLGALCLASDGRLYGTGLAGGEFGRGAVFSLTSSGSFATVYSFFDPVGSASSSGLTQAADGQLYGSAQYGGFTDQMPPGSGGTVFALDLGLSTAAPVIAPAGGTYNNSATVTITDSQSGAVIYYTTDGTTPTASSTKYTGPFTITKNTTVKAIAIYPGSVKSALVTAAYVILPPAPKVTISPASCKKVGPVTVTLTDTLGSANIYYTTDGTDPATSATAVAYVGPFSVGATATVTAIARATGYSDSAPVSATYTIIGPTYAAGINLFSAPYDYPTTPLDTLFGYTGATVAVWTPFDSRYFVSPEGLANSIRLGVGYWARFPKTITFTSAGTPADSTQPFVINLAPGWNMIGDPFTTSVPLSSVTFGAGVSYANAITAVDPIISPTMWAYNTTTKAYVKSSTLEPLKGYWLYAYKTTSMMLPGSGPPAPPI